MSIALYGHPFSSYCQKVLIALYENDRPVGPGRQPRVGVAAAGAVPCIRGQTRVGRTQGRARVITGEVQVSQ